MGKTNRKRLPNFIQWYVYVPIGIIFLIGYFSSIQPAFKSSWTFDWSGIRTEVKDTVLQIEEYGPLTARLIGYHLEKPSQYTRMIWFRKNVTIEELEQLINYPCGSVKALTYETLIRRKQHSAELLKTALSDTLTSFGYTSGCVTDGVYLGTYLYEEVLFLNHNINRNLFTKSELTEIDSLYRVLNEKNRYYN